MNAVPYNLDIPPKTKFLNILPMLFIELDNNNLKEQSSSASELVHILNKLGYTIRHAISDRAIKEGDDFSNCHFDILCD